MLEETSSKFLKDEELVSVLGGRIGALIDAFCERWILLRPEKTSDDFRSEILDGIKLEFAANPDFVNEKGEADLEKAIDLLVKLSPNQVESDFLHVYLGSVLASGAAIALNEKKINKCILSLFNAHRSYGIVEFTNFNAKLWTEQVADSALKMQSRKGVDSRGEQFQKITKIVFDYVRSEAPWPSQSEAARKSVKKLEEFGHTRTEATVYDWLKLMPDHEGLWPKR